MVTRDELITALEPDEVDYDRIVRLVGDDALPLLPELIDGERLDLAAKAASLAGLLTGAERLPALELAARSPHAVVRIAAAAAAERVSEPEASRLVPLLLDDSEPAVRKLAIRAAGPVATTASVHAALDRIAASDPVEELRAVVGELPGRGAAASTSATDPRPAQGQPTDPHTKERPVPTDDEIVERAIAKFGPVLDLRANPQAIIDIVRAARVEQPDGGLPPGGVPQPPGPTSMQGSEATLDDVMAEVLKLSRRLADATQQIADLRGRLG